MDFRQTPGNYYLSLTIAKFKVEKNSTVKNFSSIFKCFDHESINFQE